MLALLQMLFDLDVLTIRTLLNQDWLLFDGAPLVELLSIGFEPEQNQLVFRIRVVVVVEVVACALSLVALETQSIKLLHNLLNV